MDYHGITSIGKIFVQRVSTLPIWSLTDIARILYTNDNNNFYLAGVTEWQEIIDGISEQTIVGIKTFTFPPMISNDPSGGDDAVRLSYLEANYTKGSIDLSNYVTLDTTQNITGLKVFDTVLPESQLLPTDNDHLSNKLYVDTVAPKLLVTETDSTLNYLWDKITGGDGIALSKLGADGANQQIRISVSGISGGNFYSDLPIGTIIKYAGSSAPAGYLECDGAAVSRTTYDDLFNVIGEDYGIGNGTTTFNVPSCTGDNCGGEMWCIKYSESEAVNGVDEKVKVSVDDTTAGYVEQKIVAGAGISVVTNNPGGNETFEISSAAGASSTGMWLKSSGTNNCSVKAGSVVINNVIYSLSTEASLTLSGYLRDGESELANTLYYLYAVGGAGTVPTFKFSSVQPTKNKYGSTVSFSEECEKSELYHPIEGLTWRYIGEVYNNSSSNIVAFDKMYPGYWESQWVSNPYLYIKDENPGNWYIQTISTKTFNFGMGVLPTKWKGLYSATNSGITTAFDINWVCGMRTYVAGEYIYNFDGSYTYIQPYSTYWMGSFAIYISNSYTISIYPTNAISNTTNSLVYDSVTFVSPGLYKGYFKFIIEK